MKAALRRNSFVLGMFSAGLLILLAARSAEAQTIFSPFGDSPVAIQIGYWAPANQSIVSYRRLSDNYCVWTTVGTPAIQGAVSVFGSPGNDHIDIVVWDETFSCSNGGTYTFSAPFQAPSGQIFTSGKAGNDVLNCGGGWLGTGRNYCSGEDGDDLLFNYGLSGTLLGGNGNDILWSNAGAGANLYGNEGNDCLQWVVSGTAPPPNNVDCGTGTDSKAGVAGPGINCEYTVNSCI